VDLWNLERAAEMLFLEDPSIPPGGPMVPHLGRQLTLEEITNAYESRESERVDWTPDLRRVVRSIRSFPISVLRGIRVICSPDEFDGEVPSIFAAHLGDAGIKSSFKRTSMYSLVQKYHLLDAAYVAPMDEATRQSMVIELGGRVSGMDGPLEHGSTFPDTVAVEITHAHWSNVSGLGIGVGFYM
jgi:hypothetical protein